MPDGYPVAAPVEISIRLLPAEPGDMGAYDISDPDVDQRQIHADVPERVSDARMQLWLLEADASRVAVVIKSFPDTPADLVAEAEAVVRSMRVEPGLGGTGRRVVFTLEDGWDSG